MLRPLVIIGVVILAVMSFGLFQLKYEVTQLEEQLGKVRTDIAAEEESLRVLRAEWSFLNRPDRLRSLADRHLTLAVITPQQIRSIEQIPKRPAERGGTP
ncbi:MAG: hypothetical protein FJX65_05935 [Alphaproteobacteria bacterium]|nr:hypothetical protein [Alphaproteobacteria bacterium]